MNSMNKLQSLAEFGRVKNVKNMIGLKDAERM